MSRQLLLYYHYQLRSHQNISTKCYACWYYQVRNFINILKQLIGRLLKKCENRIISERGFIKAQIGGSTYRQEAQNASSRRLLQPAAKLREIRKQQKSTHLQQQEGKSFILPPPRDCLHMVKIKQMHALRGLGQEKNVENCQLHQGLYISKSILKHTYIKGDKNLLLFVDTIYFKKCLHTY